MIQKVPDHSDLLGQPLNIGDAVVYPANNSMCVGTVVKLNPKMVKVKRVGTKYAWEQNKYPNDLVRVHGAEVTMYLLRHQHS